jgi:hypothetical protein
MIERVMLVKAVRLGFTTLLTGAIGAICRQRARGDPGAREVLQRCAGLRLERLKGKLAQPRAGDAM